ncbi:MAG TPA: hypothetical protein VGF59_31935 [Bryobacteraceae bacterium]
MTRALSQIDRDMDVGNVPITRALLEREHELSARLTAARCQMASSRTGRVTALQVHLERMQRQEAILRTTCEGPRPFAVAHDHIALARVWLAFEYGG